MQTEDEGPPDQLHHLKQNPSQSNISPDKSKQQTLQPTQPQQPRTSKYMSQRAQLRQGNKLQSQVITQPLRSSLIKNYAMGFSQGQSTNEQSRRHPYHNMQPAQQQGVPRMLLPKSSHSHQRQEYPIAIVEAFDENIIPNKKRSSPSTQQPLKTNQSDQVPADSQQLSMIEQQMSESQNIDLLQIIQQTATPSTSNNFAQLKYKDYCKALMDDMSNQGHYKTAQPLQDFSSGMPNNRSASQGVTTTANSNKTTLFSGSQQQHLSSILNQKQQQPMSNNTNNSTNSGQNNTSGNQFHWSSNSNWFIQKLKNVIHSQQGRHGSMIGGGKVNRQGMLVGGAGLLSPGGQRKSNSNPFQTGKSKEDLTIYNMALGQRVILRSESINKAAVDMAPINMSAGVIDFKVQYRRQNRRFQSSTNNSSNMSMQARLLQASQFQKNAPVICSQQPSTLGNESQEYLNAAAMAEEQMQLIFNQQSQHSTIQKSQTIGLITNYKGAGGGSSGSGSGGGSNKMEMKNNRMFAVESYSNMAEKNLEKLREYEQHLLLNAYPGSQVLI